MTSSEIFPKSESYSSWILISSITPQPTGPLWGQHISPAAETTQVTSTLSWIQHPECGARVNPFDVSPIQAPAEKQRPHERKQVITDCKSSHLPPGVKGHNQRFHEGRRCQSYCWVIFHVQATSREQSVYINTFEHQKLPYD